MNDPTTVFPNPTDVEMARQRWSSASASAAELAEQLFQPGDGYGDPDARLADEHRLRTAQKEADRQFQLYHDLDRRWVQGEMLKLQRSQRLATWASFAVAAAVGVATILGILLG